MTDADYNKDRMLRMADELGRARGELSSMTLSMKNKEIEYQHQIDYLAHHAKKLRPMLQQTNLGMSSVGYYHINSRSLT